MFEGQSNRLDLFRRAAREGSDRAMLDLAVFAVALAQEIAGVFFTVLSAGGGVDVHSEYLII